MQQQPSARIYRLVDRANSVVWRPAALAVVAIFVLHGYWQCIDLVQESFG